MAKLKELLGEAFDDTPKVDKHKVIEGVRNYGIVGKSLYNNSNIMEIASQLSDIAESAHNHVLSEESDWFDKISVNKNTYWRRELDADEFKALVRWKQAMTHAMWVLYSAVLGILVKIIFF